MCCGPSNNSKLHQTGPYIFYVLTIHLSAASNPYKAFEFNTLPKGLVYRRYYYHRYCSSQISACKY